MEKKVIFNSGVLLYSFGLFPEYFIAISAIYILIVVAIITYNQYGLIIQKALSDCIGLILLMACYLTFNGSMFDIESNSLLFNFSYSILLDELAFFSKLVVTFFSALYFFLISDSLKDYKLTSFEYPLILLFAVLGLLLLCSSHDLLTAFLAIELTSLSSYILASFKKSSSYSVDAGIKYFVTGAISSAFFLLGSSFIYIYSGSIYFIDIWEVLTVDRYCPSPEMASIEYQKDLDNPHMSNREAAIRYIILWMFFQSFSKLEMSFYEFGLALILFSIFIKLALAPFHLWSLDVYEGSPTISTMFFAVLSKFSSFIFLIRLCYKAFLAVPIHESWQMYCLLVGVISVFVGSFGGIKQRRLKTLLAYSSTSHMGYCILALGTATLMGLEALMFYLIIYTISGLVTWWIILNLRLKTRILNSKYSKELGDLALMRKSNPSISIAFTLSMFSIAGIPPLIGFLAKLMLFMSIIGAKYYSYAIVSILCSVFSTFYYIRIIKVLHFENLLVGKLYHPINSNKALLFSILTFLLILLFLNPTLLYLFTHKMIISADLYDYYTYPAPAF